MCHVRAKALSVVKDRGGRKGSRKDDFKTINTYLHLTAYHHRGAGLRNRLSCQRSRQQHYQKRHDVPVWSCHAAPVPAVLSFVCHVSCGVSALLQLYGACLPLFQRGSGGGSGVRRPGWHTKFRTSYVCNIKTAVASACRFVCVLTYFTQPLTLRCESSQDIAIIEVVLT